MDNHDEIKPIKTFKANYDRVGVVKVIYNNCVICGIKKTSVYIDSSEGEYGGACICPECAVNICYDNPPHEAIKGKQQ